MTVYLIDDDELFAAYLKKELKALGHSIRHFGRARDALPQIEEEHPSVVIADWYLRGEMTGGDLIEPIRRTSPETKVIFMSGAISDLIFKTLKPFGDFTLLSKGLDSNQLVREIDKHLNAYRAGS